MSGTDDELPLGGRLAPPMANGEVVFEAPWQGRVFGMARFLAEAGHFTWDEFRQRLIAEVAAEDAAVAEDGRPFHYFDAFQRALETLVRERGLVTAPGLEARARALAERPHGHDH